MNMAQFKKLKSYMTTNKRLFPKLIPALRSLSEFVGHEDIKETVAKMVLFFISQCAQEQPLRRSKRKRRAKKKVPRKRTRSMSEDTDPDYDPSDDAKFALFALLTSQMQQSQGESSDSDSDQEDPPFVMRCREKMKLLQGHFIHTLLLGSPGTGKTTFATLLVDVWDALGIIDKRRFKITKRSDWVGKYQGHSVAKAKKLIQSCKGGVIFIDEAYSLVSAKDGDDMYGREVLTEIVESMSNPDKQVIFIMAGYEGDMKQLFTYNAGLERRFGYVYRFKTPPSALLESIFLKQLKSAKWTFNKIEKEKLREFFGKNVKALKNGGGSTQQLIFHSKQAAVIREFPRRSTSEMSIVDVEEGMKTFRHHARVFVPAPPPDSMYL